MYKREEVLRVVVECLGRMQRCCPAGGISEQSDPIRDLGCDSPDGVDFACAIDERLGICLPETVNPFVDDKRKCGRKVGEIVTLIEETTLAQEAYGAR